MVSDVACGSYDERAMMRAMHQRSKGFTLIELMIVVAIIGILAAIAIPNFIRYQVKAKQAEATTSLKSIYTAQVSYFAETDSYTSVFTALGWVAESTRRFTYDLGGATTGNNTPRVCASDVAATATTTFTAQACGQVDTDPTIDDWIVNESQAVSNRVNDAFN